MSLVFLPGSWRLAGRGLFREPDLNIVVKRGDNMADFYPVQDFKEEDMNM